VDHFEGSRLFFLSQEDARLQEELQTFLCAIRPGIRGLNVFARGESFLVLGYRMSPPGVDVPAFRVAVRNNGDSPPDSVVTHFQDEVRHRTIYIFCEA